MYFSTKNGVALILWQTYLLLLFWSSFWCCLKKKIVNYQHSTHLFFGECVTEFLRFRSSSVSFRNICVIEGFFLAVNTVRSALIYLCLPLQHPLISSANLCKYFSRSIWPEIIKCFTYEFLKLSFTIYHVDQFMSHFRSGSEEADSIGLGWWGGGTNSKGNWACDFGQSGKIDPLRISWPQIPCISICFGSQGYF